MLILLGLIVLIVALALLVSGVVAKLAAYILLGVALALFLAAFVRGRNQGPVTLGGAR